MKRSLIVLGLTILGFVLHSLIHVDAAVIALSGATILMLVGLKPEEAEDAIDTVEWETIFFFAALFTLVGGLQEIGSIRDLALAMFKITGGDLEFTSSLILWVSGLASAMIDNVPFVATMIPLIQDLAQGLGLAVNSPEINTL